MKPTITITLIDDSVIDKCLEISEDLADSLFSIMDSSEVDSHYIKAQCDFLCALELSFVRHNNIAAAELVRISLNNIIGLINDEEQLCLFRNANYSLN